MVLLQIDRQTYKRVGFHWDIVFFLGIKNQTILHGHRKKSNYYYCILALTLCHRFSVAKHLMLIISKYITTIFFYNVPKHYRFRENTVLCRAL